VQAYKTRDKIISQGGTVSYKYEVTLLTDGSVESESFYKEGELHREGDQPARIWYRADGSVSIESFYKEGELHREGDQPAWISYRYDGSVSIEWFYKEGQLHREGDRPARIEYRADSSVETERFYKEGHEYTPNKTGPCEGKTVEIDGIKYVLMPAD
jgi:antitoxin component YwqK of YwqJK toxin-antitoxin module